MKARDSMGQVGHAAWACADPGIQYHDTVNAWHTCPVMVKFVALTLVLNICS